ncbi:cobalt-precorrin-6A reductase [Parafrankia soli]|uniref:Cobalt-precorrin-6A reductase n=1 Tax=Parafrankia soli TaxID=2599596 RepID=A0A1S1QY91_9ACTN|nr:cobalt-precorrin-6A reductase [Parafrankia soli]OHV39658.1 cobalt-precorrin-6A reductase [Parafrankia soli]
MTRRVLLLGGTAEARRLAAALADRADLDVVYSLAGRLWPPTASTVPAGATVRSGGFGGPDGLVEFLREHDVAAVVDATHPFAARITAAAVAACAATGVPLLVVRRPGWTESDGDDWRRVPSLPAAAALLAAGRPGGPSDPGELGEPGEPGKPGERRGRRVFLTVGRSGVAAFAGLDHWFLARSVEPPPGPVPRRLRVLLDRGPFTVDAETALLRRHEVDTVVTKDSGGSLTAAKLVAARRLRLPVVMVDRPPLPRQARVVATPSAAISWLTSSPA